jgi:catechol 2,3-dioxygenase-like lactoylglutathione lyase family enzyme
MLPENCTALPPERNSVIKPYCLSHGTLEVKNLKNSRKFYEEFLGLECVRHGKPAMVFRLGMRFHVVCVEVGEDQIHPVSLLNHWGVDVGTREAVNQAHADAVKYQEKYGIKQVKQPQEMHGVYSFYLEDLDHNWWEIQHYENGFQHDDFFDFGDRFSMDEEGLAGELEELKVKSSTPS